MSRKRLRFLAGIVCMGLLSGCGNNTVDSGTANTGATDSGAGSESEPSADETTSGANAESSGAQVLTMMLNGAASDAYVEGYQKIIDAFNADNEYGVVIEPEFVSNSDYKTKLTTMMVSDSEPDIIFTWELGYLENFVNGGKIVN